MNEEITNEIETSTTPNLETSRTYQLINGRIRGMIDGIPAIKQFVHKTLNTERFIYPIYSQWYATELARFIGEDFDFITADLERTIDDALTDDYRIQGIENFRIEQTSKDSLMCHFRVVSVEGLFEIEDFEVRIR